MPWEQCEIETTRHVRGNFVALLAGDRLLAQGWPLNEKLSITRPESLAILQWNEQQKGDPYGLVRTGCAFWIQVPHLDRLPIRLQKKTAWWNRWQCTAFPRILVHFIKKVNKDIERSYGCKNYWESFNTCFCAGRHFLTLILPWIKIYSLFLLNIERIYQGKRMRLILRESR